MPTKPEIRDQDLSANVTGSALRRAIFDFLLAGTSASWPGAPENALRIMGLAETINAGLAKINRRDLVFPLDLDEEESAKFLSALTYREEIESLSLKERWERRRTNRRRYSFPNALGRQLDETLAANDVARFFSEEMKAMYSKLSLSLTDMMTFMRAESPEAAPVALFALGDNQWLKPAILYGDGSLLVAHSLHPFDLLLFLEMSSLADDRVEDALFALADETDDLGAIRFRPVRRVGRATAVLPTRLNGQPAISLVTSWLETTETSFANSLDRVKQTLSTYRQNGVRFLGDPPAEALNEIQEWADEVRRRNRGW